MDTEMVPCDNLTYFEMCSALRWALDGLNNSPGVKIVLDVTGLDETSRWFLANHIPQPYTCTKLVRWIGTYKTNEERNIIEYTNGNDGDDNNENEKMTFLIRAFTDTACPSSVCVTLYNISTHVRFAPLCLVIWDRRHPEVTNQGYAEGRCPNSISP